LEKKWDAKGVHMERGNSTGKQTKVDGKVQAVTHTAGRVKASCSIRGSLKLNEIPYPPFFIVLISSWVS
jgi:hypothetical protein